MLLLLQGPSDVALAALANMIVKNGPEWRYLSPETVDGILGQLIQGGDEAMAFILAESVRGLEEDGLHAVMPCPSNELSDMLREELKDSCITVLLDEDPSAADHDYHVNPKGKSAKKLYEEIAKLFE